MKAIINVLFVLITINLSAQIIFNKTYGGIGNDYPSCVIQTSDNGYAITGGIETNSQSDVYFIKTNLIGDTLWTKKYGGNQYDRASSIIQTSDDGYFLLGQSLSFGNNSGSFYLIKTNSSGDTIWTKTYNGLLGRKIIKCNDNNYLLFGYPTGTTYSIKLIKIDPNGNIIWQKTFNNHGSKDFGDIQKTSDNGFIVGAVSNSDMYLLKVNSIGDSLWSKTYGGTSNDYVASITILNDGNYLLGGHTWSYSPNSQIYLIKTNISGDTIWTKRIQNNYDLSIEQIMPNNLNGFYLIGETTVNGDDILFLNCNSYGDTIFTKKFGGNLSESGKSFTLTNDNGIALLGSTKSYGNGLTDYYFIKLDSTSITSNVSLNNNESKNKFYVFPNPITISSILKFNYVVGNKYSFKLYNIYGKLIEQNNQINNEYIKIDKGNKQIGIYLFRVELENEIIVQGKIMIE